MPASFWKWRMAGGFVTLADGVRDTIEAHGPVDVVVASSMTNLPGLLGLCRTVLAGVPAALYMHESQLTYPLSPLDREDLTYAMINWTSMAAADAVFFNSQFHLDTWFGALPAFIGRFPDARHTDQIDPVRERSSVLPVGVDLTRLDGVPRRRRGRPLILWNQRWEHDKGPDEFAAAMLELARRGCDFELALAGESFAEQQEELTGLANTLGERIIQLGFAEEPAYRDLLRCADIVVSTARQEFFGIGVTEAVYAGAMPILPNRLVYPERIPDALHPLCLYRTYAELIERLEWALENRTAANAIGGRMRDVMAPFDWAAVAPRYDEALEGLRSDRSR
jgi:glycosyltransferase involved in cell wall biosynthesis